LIIKQCQQTLLLKGVESHLFAIRNAKGEYLVWIHPATVAWTKKLASAKTFANQEKANAFLQNRRKANQVSKTESFSIVDSSPSSSKKEKQGSVLIRDEQGQYLVWRHPHQLSWTKDVTRAKSFKSKKAAEGFLNSEKKQLENKQEITLIPFTQALSYSASAVRSSADTKAKESHPVVSSSLPSPIPAPTSTTPLLSNASSEASPLQDPLPLEEEEIDLFTEDSFETILQAFPYSLHTLSALFQSAKEEQEKCLHEIKQADLETADILHKMEFTRADVVRGYRLYRMVHDCRIRRRKAKDRAEFLQIVLDSGLLQPLQAMNERYQTYQNYLQTRTYRPRVREDLFDV